MCLLDALGKRRLWPWVDLSYVRGVEITSHKQAARGCPAELVVHLLLLGIKISS